jgi:hypothetical protein
VPRTDGLILFTVSQLSQSLTNQCELHVAAAQLLPQGTPGGHFYNPLHFPVIRKYIERLIKNAPFFCWLFTGGRSNNSSLEQNNQTIRYNDVVSPWGSKTPIYEWAERMGLTMSGKGRQAIVNLDRSAYELTPSVALMFSEWNKSGVHFTPEMRDMQRELGFRYHSLGPQRRLETFTTLQALSPAVTLTVSQITATMHCRRAFWKDTSELDVWRRWLDTWTVPDMLAMTGGLKRGHMDGVVFDVNRWVETRRLIDRRMLIPLHP